MYNILELFSGTSSFGNVAKLMGHNIFTVEINKEFNPDYVIDILKLDYAKIPFKPDIIWASPPCESFSVASIGKHWNHDNTPKTDNARHGLKLVEKTWEIIEHYNPKYYFIENPRGKLRKLDIMKKAPIRQTISYCQYGDTRMKPTDIWTNCNNWQPKQICKNGMPCHESAPRGSRTGTQGIKTYKQRSAIPKDLCKEILKSL